MRYLVRKRYMKKEILIVVVLVGVVGFVVLVDDFGCCGGEGGLVLLNIEMLDIDGDGVLLLVEIEVVLEVCFVVVDVDGDGSLLLDELIVMVEVQIVEWVVCGVEYMLDCLDVNEDGVLIVDEFQLCGGDWIECMFECFDVDEDGILIVEEFEVVKECMEDCCLSFGKCY